MKVAGKPAVLALLAAILVAGAAPLFAVTSTFTIQDNYDDAFVSSPTGEYYSENYIQCGKVSGYSSPYYMGVVRFSGVTIPQGSVISSAYLRVQASYTGSASSKFLVYGEDTDSADPLNEGDWIVNRDVTSAYVTWSTGSAWTLGTLYTSPDLKTVIQEIVSRSGWYTGNALALQLWKDGITGSYQKFYSKEGADASSGTYSSAELIVTYANPENPDGVKSENYIPGATNAVSSVPLYLNNPDMYYPAEQGGICWATANADIFAYWDRNATGGVTYWSLIDNGTAPLRQPTLPSAPGHDQADVKTAIAWLAYQYYTLDGYMDEKGVLEEFANQTNGLAFNVTYHGAVSSTADRTTYFGTMMSEINAGRPISIGSYGTYFGGGHQVPVIGYREMSNAVNSMVYIHLNTGGTQDQYANPYASNWGYLDMDQIVPGGTPVDQYEAVGDDSAATTVAIQPDDTYNFRQTHNFSASGDVDWIRLSTVSGRKYVIATTNLGASCDTVLGVYQSDGTRLLLSDDDSGTEPRSSRIEFRCWSTGTHLLRLYDKADGNGPTANYDVQVSYSSITNEAPTDLSLSPSVVAENQPSGTTVGTLSTTDPDVGNTFAYTLVSGSGSGDNAAFTISGSALETAETFDYEAKSSYAVRVRTTDQNGLSFEKALTVSVTDVVETCVVTFDAQGGTVEPSSAVVTNGQTYGVLPEPEWAGYTHSGWWTLAGGSGTLVTASTVVTQKVEHTLYADWSLVVTAHGTPGTWLVQYGLVTGGDYETPDTADADGDGYSAWKEYVAGTDPTNSASVFLANLLRTEGGILLHWVPDLTGAVPARVYSVYGTPSLAAGFPSVPITNLPAGTPLPLLDFSTNRFFKIGVGLEP